MSRRETWGWSRSLLFVAVVSSGCVFEGEENVAAPCLSGLSVGQTLTFTLEALYDAQSDYLFDRQYGAMAVSTDAPTSCNARDGLQIGQTVTLVLGEPRHSEVSGPIRCGAYRASVTPEVFGNLSLVDTGSGQREGVSIAVSSNYGTLAGQRWLVERELITPKGDMHAAAVPRELPPLVLRRRLQLQGQQSFLGCADAWVVTLKNQP